VTSAADISSLLTGLYPGRAAIGSNLLTGLEHLNPKSAYKLLDRVGFNTNSLDPNKTRLNPSLPSARNLELHLFKLVAKLGR